MTDARWLLVKEIFHSALALAPEQRTAFLRDTCGKDVALPVFGCSDVRIWNFRRSEHRRQ